MIITAEVIGAVFALPDDNYPLGRYLGFLPLVVDRDRLVFSAEPELPVTPWPLGKVPYTGSRTFEIRKGQTDWTTVDSPRGLYALVKINGFIPSRTVLWELLGSCAICGEEVAKEAATIGFWSGHDDRSFLPLLCRSCWGRRR